MRNPHIYVFFKREIWHFSVWGKIVKEHFWILKTSNFEFIIELKF